MAAGGGKAAIGAGVLQPATAHGHTLRAIADTLAAAGIAVELAGDDGLVVERPVPPAEASGAGDLAVAIAREQLPALAGCPAGAAMIAAGATPPAGSPPAVLRVGEPRYALAALLRLFDRPVRVEPGIHGSAVIHPSAHVAEGAAIGAFVQVGAQARIGARTALLSHVSIGAEARIGADCLLHPGVRIGDRVLVGDRVIIHHNASLGSDGFGFAAPELAVRNPSAPRRPIERINSIGTVVVGDDVEIGASTTIDRGTLGETRLGRGTKIDNLVQIGHNTIVGEDCLICGNVGISGSCRVGNRVVIAGGAGIADHLSLGDDCVVMAAAAVGSDVPARTAVVGMPAIARQDFFQQYKSLRRLKRTLDEVAALRELRERVEALEAERGTDRTR